MTIDQVREMLAIDEETGVLYHDRKPTAAFVLRSAVSLLNVSVPEGLLVPVHHSIRQFLFPHELKTALEKNTCGLSTDIRTGLTISKQEALLELADLSMRHIQSRARAASLPVQRTHLTPVPQLQAFLPRPLRSFFPSRSSSPTASWRLPVLERHRHDEATAFYNYAIHTWIKHTSDLERKDLCWQVFEDLATRTDISPSHQPWWTESCARTRTTRLRAMFGYAVANNHVPLLWLVLDQRKVLPPQIFDHVLPGNELVPALHLAASAGFVRMINALKEVCSPDSRCPRQGRTALHYAALNGHIDAWSAVQQQLHLKGIDSEPGDFEGCTPIFLAIAAGHTRFVEHLLSTGQFSIDSPNKAGERPLFKAAEAGRKDLVKLLLDSKAVDVNAKNTKHQETALWTAAKHGHVETTSMLLHAAGIDLGSQTTQQGRKLLYAAASSGNAETLRAVLTATPQNIDSMDDYRKALIVASARGHVESVKVLLEPGKAEPTIGESDGAWALFLAAAAEHLPIVRVLFETGKIDPSTSRRDTGWTPLFRAAFSGSIDVVEYLLEVCKVPPDPKTHNNETPLSVAAECGHYGILSRLMSTGRCDLNVVDRTNGRTPLLKAVRNRHEHAVEILLNYEHINLNHKDLWGNTALTHATDTGQNRVVEMLLSSGRADINLADLHGCTALHIAAKSGSESLVELLLTTGGANVNLRDEDGKTPLASAVETGREGVVKQLLAVRETDVSLSDRRGQSPLNVAKKYEHRSIVRLLEQRLKDDNGGR